MEQATYKVQHENRRGEKGPVPPRRKRIFLTDKQWYVMTRNGQEHGPYQNLTEAKRELALFLRRSGVVKFKL